MNFRQIIGFADQSLHEESKFALDFLNLNYKLAKNENLIPGISI